MGGPDHDRLGAGGSCPRERDTLSIRGEAGAEETAPSLAPRGLPRDPGDRRPGLRLPVSGAKGRSRLRSRPVLLCRPSLHLDPGFPLLGQVRGGRRESQLAVGYTASPCGDGLLPRGSTPRRAAGPLRVSRARGGGLLRRRGVWIAVRARGWPTSRRCIGPALRLPSRIARSSSQALRQISPVRWSCP